MRLVLVDHKVRKVRKDRTALKVRRALKVHEARRVRIATNRETVASHPSGALTSKGYVDQIKTDIKAIAAASSSFADFQTRIAAW